MPSLSHNWKRNQLHITIILGIVFMLLVGGIIFVYQDKDVPIARGQATSIEYCVPGSVAPCAPPISEWRIDEFGDDQCAGSLDVCDSSGSNYHGARNGATWTSGTSCFDGVCLALDGVDDYVRITDPGGSWDFGAGGLDGGTDDFSISAWVKLSSSNLDRIVSIVGKGATAPTSAGYWFSYYDEHAGGSGDLRIYLSDGTTRYPFNSYDYLGLADDTWHHVAVVVERGATVDRVEFFLDGASVGVDQNTTMVGRSVSSTYDVAIGRNLSTSTRFWKGAVDMVRAFNYLRTSDQIKWEYDQGTPVSWWLLNEGMDSPTTCNANVSAVTEHVQGGVGSVTLGAAGNTSLPAAWVNSSFKCALSFDGVDDEVAIGGVPVGQSVHTVSFWIQRGSTDGFIMDLDGGAHTLTLTGGVIIANGFVQPNFFIDGVKSATPTLPAGWHHVAVSTSVPFDPTNVSFGRVGGQYFDGVLDDIRFFDTQWVPAVPSISFSGTPSAVYLDTPFNFNASLTNVGQDTGYKPFIDIHFPFNGTDGVSTSAQPLCANRVGDPLLQCDGVDFVSILYAGSSLTATILEFPYASTGSGCVNHPLAFNGLGLPVQVCGPSGDKLVTFLVPFSSVTPADPAITVSLTGTVSNLADYGVPLPIHVRGGFALGIDSFQNPTLDPSIIGSFNTLNVTPLPLQETKTLVGTTTNETVSGVNYPYTFEGAVDVAGGQTIAPLRLTDMLSKSVVYNNFVGASGGGAPVEEPIIGFPQNPPFNDLIVSWGSVLGTAVLNDAWMRFGFHVPANDADGVPVVNPGTGACQTIANDVFASGDWFPLDTRDASTTIQSDVRTQDYVLTACSLLVSKSAAVVNDVGIVGFSPGDTLEYTVRFDISDYFAFQNFTLTDIFSDGIVFDPTFIPTLSVTEHGLVSAGAVNGGNYTVVRDTCAPPGTCTGDTTLTLNVSSELTARGGDGLLLGGCVPNGGGPLNCSVYNGGATQGTFVFRVQVLSAYTDSFLGTPNMDQGDAVRNMARAGGEIVNTTTLVGTGTMITDDSTQATNRIPWGQLQSKAIYAINGNTTFPIPPHVDPGDTVTFQVIFQNTTSDIESLTITDFFPIPFFNATEITGPIAGIGSQIDATTPPAGQFKFGASDTFYTLSGIVPSVSSSASNNTATFSFGSFSANPEQASTIELLFTATVTSAAFDDGFLFSNRVQAIEGNSTNESGTSLVIGQGIIQQPDVVITKGIVKTDHAGATFTPGTVAPLSFSAPGGTCPRFSGTINSTDLTTKPINSNVSGVDAGDLVTYVLTLENTGSAGDGAFDVRIKENLLQGLQAPGTGINLCVTDGTGTAVINYTDLGGGILGSGIELNDPGPTASPLGALDPYDAANGRNVAIISFDLEVTGNISFAQTIRNTGTLFNYANQESGEDHTLQDRTDEAQASLVQPALAHTIVATSETHSGAVEGLERLAIGEIVRLRTQARIAEGTQTNLYFTELVPLGVEFLNDGTAKVAFVANGPGNITSTLLQPGAIGCPDGGATPLRINGNETTVNDPLCPFPASFLPGPYGEGTDVRFDLGTVNNQDRDGDNEFIIVEANYLVANTANNPGGNTLTSTAEVYVSDLVQPSDTEALTMYTLAPALDFSKTILTTPQDAGDTFVYEIVITNISSSANSGDVFDLTIDGIFSPNTPLILTDVTTAAPGYATVTDTTNYATNTVTLAVDRLNVLDAITTTVTVQIKDDARNGWLITSTSDIGYTSLPGLQGTLGNPTGSNTPGASGTAIGERDGSNGATGSPNNYAAQLVRQVTLDPPSLAIQDPVPATVSIGQTVLYRMLVTIPEGVAPAFLITDDLPRGLRYESYNLITTAAASGGDLGGDYNGSWTALVVTAFGGSGDDVTFDFGDMTTPVDGSPSTDQFIIDVTARLLNEKGNPLSSNLLVKEGNQDGTLLINTATRRYREPNGDTLDTVAEPSPEIIEVVEPVVLVDKTIVVPPLPPFPGSKISFAASFAHHPLSHGSAYDLEFTDVIPQEMVNTVVTVVNAWGGAIAPSTEITGTPETLYAPQQADVGGFDLPAQLSQVGYCITGDPSYCADPIAHWKIDEGIDDQCGTFDVCDSSSNGQHGNRINATWQIAPTCIDGGCLSFSRSTGDKVSVPDSPVLRPGDSSWTIALFARPPNAPDRVPLVGKPDNGAPYGGYQISIGNGSIHGTGAGKKIQFAYTEISSGIERSGATVSDVVNGNWMHIVAVADKSADTIRIYINGVLQPITIDTNLGAWPVLNNTEPVLFGTNTIAQYYNGLIDDVRIYNYARTANQIQYEYQQRLSTTQGSRVDIVFEGELWGTFMPGDFFTNSGEVRWTSINSSLADERTGVDGFYRNMTVLNDYRAQDAVTFYSTVCSKMYQGAPQEGYCTTDNQCNIAPTAGIVITQQGDITTTPFIFTAENSYDDLTPLTALRARWDFDYDGVSPVWDENAIFIDPVFGNTPVSHQYGAYGDYRVALQVRDDDGVASQIVVRYITLAPPGIGQLAISPVAFPATNIKHSYNYGIIGNTSIAMIEMLVCNVGSEDLTVNGFTLGGPDTNKFAYVNVGGAPPFTLTFDPASPVECNTTNAQTSYQKVQVSFIPGGATGTFLADLLIDSSENDITVNLQGTGRTGTVLVPSDTAPEMIIYDGRTLINPPPGFIEFLEKVRTQQPAKPR